MDDTQLAHRLSRDLDGAFESLVHAHVDRCHAIAHRMTGNPHDAEEITQEALVRAYRALATYDPMRIQDLQIRPWLATIVLNLCRNRARSRHVSTTPLDALVEAGREPVADAASDPAGTALRTADREWLAARLAALPERYRAPIVLRHVDDFSYAEIAAVLGRPEGTLKAQVHRGLALLRAAIAATELEELTA